MFSSISVPPRSLTPQRSASVAASRPIFTQLACTLGIVRPSARRKTAVCLRFSSREISSIAVRAPEQRVERDERQRHELGDPARALLQLAHDAHVLGQLPRLLDVAEHHRRRRAQPGGVEASMISTQRATGSLFGRDALAHAVVQHLGRGARRRVQPGLAQPREDLARRQAGDVAHVRDLHRRVGVQVQRAARSSLATRSQRS